MNTMTENPAGMPPAGRIFNIQHFCVDDGPGIRTTVFLKGCPLRCAWCHNPESHEAGTEILFRAEQCCGCSACVSACDQGAHSLTEEKIHRYDRTQCVFCGKCVSSCPTGALERAGDVMTVDEVLADLLKDRIFYQSSKGGVTLSGGEPTAQPRFAHALLAACKAQGLHTCMETSGWCSAEVMERLCPLVDLFLVDWKVSDDALHRRFTKVSNEPVRQNLALLSRMGAAVILRCPLIPDVNMDTSHYDGIAALAASFPNIQQIELEPYHPMGLDKCKALGREAAYSNPSFLRADAAGEVMEYLQKRVSLPVRISGK